MTAPFRPPTTARVHHDGPAYPIGDFLPRILADANVMWHWHWVLERVRTGAGRKHVIMRAYECGRIGGDQAERLIREFGLRDD